MSDDHIQPTGEGQPGSTQPGAADTAASGDKVTFTQEQVNALLAKERKGISKKLETTEAELTRLRETQKTEQEKQLDAVRNEVKAEYEGKIKETKIDAELRLQLHDKGYNPEFIHVVKATQSIEDLADIPSAIDAAIVGKQWVDQKPIIPSQSGTPAERKGAGITLQAAQAKLAARIPFTDDERAALRSEFRARL